MSGRNRVGAAHRQQRGCDSTAPGQRREIDATRNSLQRWFSLARASKAVSAGIHLGSPQGPVLEFLELPYSID